MMSERLDIKFTDHISEKNKAPDKNVQLKK